MVSSKVIKAPETLFEKEIRGSDVRHTLAFRTAQQSLDINLVDEFSCRLCIMKSVPRSKQWSPSETRTALENFLIFCERKKE